MDIEQIRNIAVVGAGLMGHGIALDFAMAGFDVHLQDLDEQRIPKESFSCAWVRAPRKRGCSETAFADTHVAAATVRQRT